MFSPLCFMLVTHKQQSCVTKVGVWWVVEDYQNAINACRFTAVLAEEMTCSRDQCPATRTAQAVGKGLHLRLGGMGFHLHWQAQMCWCPNLVTRVPVLMPQWWTLSSTAFLSWRSERTKRPYLWLSSQLSGWFLANWLSVGLCVRLERNVAVLVMVRRAAWSSFHTCNGFYSNQRWEGMLLFLGGCASLPCRWAACTLPWGTHNNLSNAGFLLGLVCM